MKKANIPVFVAHRGCKNSCVFCNQRRITGTDGDMTPEKAEEIIKSFLPIIKGEAEIAFFGGSFTGIPMNEQTALLKVASSYVDGKKIKGIRLSTRPDYINKEIIENLLIHNVKTVELGAQSTDEEVLALAKRGHTKADIENASFLIKEAGLNLGLQMMLGLRGATREKDIQTAKDFIALGPKEVRIYPTLVLRDTELYDEYIKKVYVPLTMEEAVTRSAIITDMFEKAGITVIRTGLQMSESLEKGYVAGPYHPSFGEMVKSRLILNRIVELAGDGEVEVLVSDDMMSKFIGQKRSNIKALNEKFGDKVKITPSEEKGIYIISNNKKLSIC